MLLTGSLLFIAQPAFSYNPRPPAQGGTDLSELGSPTESVNQENCNPSPPMGNFE